MPVRVLLIHRDTDSLDHLAALLAPLATSIDRATTPAEIAAALAGEPPDLLVVDLGLAGAADLVAAHRSAPDVALVPALLLGDRAQARELEGALDAGEACLSCDEPDGSLLGRARTLLRLRTLAVDLARSRAQHAAQDRDAQQLQDAIVHDLKGPIAVARMSMEWLRERVPLDDPDNAGALQDAEDATRRLQRMVEDLLAVSRLEGRTLPVRRDSVSLADIASASARAHARDAEARGVAIDLALEQAWVMADRSLLQRAIDALVDSTLRRTPRGGRVGIATFEEGARITVSSSARGLADAERAIVFDKLRGSRDGAGLGLYLGKIAVEAQGGALSVSASDAWPLTFTAALPPT